MGERVACFIIAFAVVAPLSGVALGQRIEAAQPVRVASQEVKVQLGRGLARVDVTLRFESEDARTAELRLLLPRPEHGALESLRACTRGRCVPGLPDTTRFEDLDAYEVAIEARGGAHHRAVARVVEGYEGGPVFELHAAPVSSAAPVVVELSYVAPLETVGGRLSLPLPLARDVARVANPAVEVLGPDGSPGSFDRGRAYWDIPAGTTLTSAWSVRCGARRCARVWTAAGYESPPRDVLILVDRSPSMRDLPRDRVQRTLDALLAELPDGSRVRLVGFGVRAEELLPPTDVAQVDVASIPLEPELSLGAGTNIDAGLAYVHELAGHLPLVIVLDDRPRQPTSAMMHALSQVHASLSFLSLGARTSSSSAFVRTLGLADAGELTRPELRQVLRSALGTLVSPLVTVRGLGDSPRSGALHAGQALLFEGELSASHLVVDGAGRTSRTSPAPPSIAAGLGVMLSRQVGVPDRRASRVTVAAHDLGANEKWRTPWLDAYPVLRNAVGPVELRQTTPVMLGPDYAAGRVLPIRPRVPPIIRCYSCCGVSVRGALSKEVLRRLMTPVEPRVRACFAQERRGRPDWSARAVYGLVLERREVAAKVVTGSNISERLEACLLDAVDQLVIPFAEGVVVIHYPYVSEAIPAAPSIPVDPALGSTLDRLFEAERAETP